MATYGILADVIGDDVQNLQELTKTLSEIESEIDRLDGDLIDAYAVLGDHDLRFTYEADDPETAIKIAVAIERYGLDTRTYQMLDVDGLGDLVGEL